MMVMRRMMVMRMMVRNEDGKVTQEMKVMDLDMDLLSQNLFLSKFVFFFRLTTWE